MRAFVRLREALATNVTLARRIDELAATQHHHAVALVAVIREIRQLKARAGASRASAFTSTRSSPRIEVGCQHATPRPRAAPHSGFSTSAIARSSSLRRGPPP
jgi:hypothetical protein